MNFFKHLNSYFTRLEKILWSASSLTIIISSYLLNGNVLSLLVSLIGVTSLIFLAKGNPIGQFLMVIFSLIYGYISYTFSYYGEMLTYLGMTMPMSVAALYAWLKHPYQGNLSEVTISSLKYKDYIYLLFLTIIITLGFHYVLKYFNTNNLVFSTISISTSFIAVYFTYKRSPLYALGYALNDIVLILMWILASFEDKSYISMVICFICFFFNDIYGFISWRKIYNRQQSS